VTGHAEQADRGVAQGGHDLWSVTRSELVAIFVEGDSRTQCRAFSIPQCPWIQVATVAGGAAIMSSEQTA
jgi:hypothetical protein